MAFWLVLGCEAAVERDFRRICAQMNLDSRTVRKLGCRRSKSVSKPGLIGGICVFWCNNGIWVNKFARARLMVLVVMEGDQVSVERGKRGVWGAKKECKVVIYRQNRGVC